jgi:serine/threonine protein kinase
MGNSAASAQNSFCLLSRYNALTQMALSIGTKLGPYEIVAPLGAGGMGEVYRARDTKLRRDVALKVLPAAFAADPERMARFRREAQVLASLNHPHIGAIYGFDDFCNVHALVMELIEGPTLANRIARGAIPIDEALPIAREIAEALEAAHERGIVHRDLKPANIKITPDGNVKVIDFGLAKAVESDVTSIGIQNSPTISQMATQAGIILGTAAYMSPEQAKGKSVDRRTDIWAFGCVLFEMLTATRPFEGETVSDALAAVIRGEPDWPLLPSNTQHTIRKVLQRCLKKDPKQRLQAIGDARIAIEEVLSGDSQDLGPPVEIRPPAWRRVLPWAVFAAVTFAAVFAAVYFMHKPQSSPVIVSQIPSPPNTNFVFTGINPGPLILSPDGERVAFSAVSSDGRQLIWVRPLSSAAAKPLDGTDGATFPFWSPDSRSLGFFANGSLNRIDVSGGPPLALCDVAIGRGGTWGVDGTILFTPNVSSPVFRIAASGGSPQAVTNLNASMNERSHRWAQFLPDNKHFLFFAQTAVVGTGSIYVASIDGGEPKFIMHNDSNAVYSLPGYLLFVHQGIFMAQRFNASRLRLDGDAVPLIEHVGVNSVISRALFAVSETGIMVYQAGNPTGETDRLVWYDRTGKQIEATGTSGLYLEPSVSADSNKLAISGLPEGTGNLSIWVLDIARSTKTRLTFSQWSDRQPDWAPDGKSIAFISNRNGPPRIYLTASDGTGTPAALTTDGASEFMPRFTGDGRYLLFERLAEQPNSRREIWAAPLSGDRKAFPVIQSQYDVFAPSLSFDGKWLAYESREAGRPEICVIPFLHGTGKWEVSTAGGLQPRWRRDNSELFYLSMDNKITSAEITQQGSSLLIGKVQSLFQVNPVPSAGGSQYDVTGDGKKFVVASLSLSQASEPLTLVVNWPALMKQK